MIPLIMASTVLSGLLSLAMFFYMRTNKNYPGFGHWTLGMFIITIAQAINILRGIVPDAVPIIIGNTFFVLSAVLFLNGIIKFLGAPGMNSAWYLCPLTNFAACGFFYFVNNDVNMRVIFFALSISIPYFYSALLLLKHSSKEKLTFYPIISVEMIMMVFLMLFRVWSVVSSDNFSFLTDTPSQHVFFITGISLQVVICISFIMLNSERLYSHLMKTYTELERSMSTVKVLSGLLPICSSCKKIRDEKNDWIQMESFISARSQADFSHGICPDCMKKLYPDYCKNIEAKEGARRLS